MKLKTIADVRLVKRCDGHPNEKRCVEDATHTINTAYHLVDSVLPTIFAGSYLCDSCADAEREQRVFKEIRRAINL